MPRNPKPDAQFKGFSRPNYTIVPDELFHELLPDLTGAELKVLLYIVRRTFGFKRDSDSISLSQMLNGITTHDGRTLDRGAGLSKPTLLQALRSLQEKGIILTERRRSVDRGDEPTVYRLRFAGDTPGKTLTLPVVKKVDQGGGQTTFPGPWSKNLTTQETVVQDTELQETDQYSNGIAIDTEHKIREPLGVTALRQEIVENSADGEADRLPEAAPGPAGFASIGNLLAQRHPLRTAPAGREDSAGRGRPPKVSERVAVLMEELTHKLHDDPKNVRSNITRAARLWKASGLSDDAFYHRLHEAKSLTQQQGGVKKAATDGYGTINRMPYFFAVVEDLVGLKNSPQEQGRG